MAGTRKYSTRGRYLDTSLRYLNQLNRALAYVILRYLRYIKVPQIVMLTAKVYLSRSRTLDPRGTRHPTSGQRGKRGKVPQVVKYSYLTVSKILPSTLYHALQVKYPLSISISQPPAHPSRLQKRNIQHHTSSQVALRSWRRHDIFALVKNLV